MVVVGGVYKETCREPDSADVFGSGLRGAAALASTGQVRLVSCVDSETRPTAEAVAAAFGLNFDFSERLLPINFSYYTPSTPPVIDGTNQAPVNLSVGEPSSPVLVFGMLEAEPVVSAKAIVYDPQRPRGASAIDRGRLAAERFAVVGNMAEVRSLGGMTDIRQAARTICMSASAEVVVVKRGPLGALVVGPDGRETAVGPYRTDRVWPIGSGDVFSAVFAWAWLEDGRNPVEAARLASAATSRWSGTRALSDKLSAGISPAGIAHGIPLDPRDTEVPVYLAGPFFNIGSRWLVDLVRQSLLSCGAAVFSPFHDVGRGGDEVVRADMDGLAGSEVILGLLDGADSGTLFEMGYAAAAGKPVVGYAEFPDHPDYKMLRGLGCFATSDLSTAVYRSIWSGMSEA